MNEIIRFLFIALLSIGIMVMNMNLSTYARSTKYLKEDVEVAVHDAALMLDEEALSLGKVVFNEVKAKEQFEISFERNTGLKKEEYEIVQFILLDDSNSSFPLDFKLADFNISEYYTGPTIFAMVESATDKYFFGAKKEEVRRSSSYSYESQASMSNSRAMVTSIDIGSINGNGLYWPVPYTKNITSEFQKNRPNPVTGVIQDHKGIDIAASGVLRQPTISVADGKVMYAGKMGTYGNLVIVDHGNGIETRYAHLDSVNVTTGSSTEAGNIVGFVGSTGNSTGPHLHFEIRIDGIPVNPLLYYQ